MNSFHLFLPDFRELIRGRDFKAEENLHQLMYYESDEIIRFYKPLEFVVYITTIFKEEKLLQDILDVIKELKSKATELPVQPDAPKVISGTIN